jgi:hypothetical protein
MVDGRRGGTMSGGRRISMGAGWSTRRAQDGARDRALDEEQRMVIYDVLFRRACTDLPTPRQACLGDGWLGEGAAGNQPAHARSRTAHSLASTFFPAATPSSLCSVLLCSLTFLSSHFSPALLPRLRSTPALVHPISQPKRTPPSSLRPAPAASTSTSTDISSSPWPNPARTLPAACPHPARALLAPCPPTSAPAPPASPLRTAAVVQASTVPTAAARSYRTGSRPGVASLSTRVRRTRPGRVRVRHGALGRLEFIRSA